MKRYYSHYTFIYPDICLKNHIVELNDDDKITTYFPFEAEIEKTEFYSGLLIFLPDTVSATDSLMNSIKSEVRHRFTELDIPDDQQEINILQYHI
ncbi:hypothetical protein M2451_002173 [Dysgonomonas sp. PFB1-18]|uniref:hypothetical protein n=1 Tax=unclassified Dysgonomonas TaxID=2630389 RepID=UPI002476E8D9|nr:MULTISPECIES: hypothetical protein [unclassified Dysgonomonas]MDL2303289.1 hypothetical protein [Dysgonomonas sp. OttesenSCG-928-D17]MDH6309643.1 hypothetical protein [Dysgonomonas sp. PF1-14]MDH6339349.1 hypothetical protein [Dysgonomonas sp. PF1-16]MDH6380848.1 hypothetical protein [Dysgonomonas sp. PFB1-18]MDH6398344.1 hypothetical protein [Dysgonomonas sp. PF1-23]